MSASGDMILPDFIRDEAPIAHCITNYVTANDCANILLASGSSAIMSDDPEEVADIVSLSDALVINIGTLNDHRLTAMHVAGSAANRLGKPVILDPVGAGASARRTDAALRLIGTIDFDIIRGNISEIRALTGRSTATRGVDAAIPDRSELQDEAKNLAGELSSATGAAVCVSGDTDILASEEITASVHNGHLMMRSVTGSGCMLSALTGAFAGALYKRHGAHSYKEDIFRALLGAVCVMGVCGELAHERLMPGEGNATYRNRLIDAVCNIDDKTVSERARYEITGKRHV